MNAEIDDSLQLIRAAKRLKQTRPVTAVESLVTDALRQQPSNFWSTRREAALNEKNYADNEDALKAIKELRGKFAENLGGKLDRFFVEVTRSPPDKQLLRETMFDVRALLWRYRHHVEDTLPGVALAVPRNELLTAIDTLQLAVARQLRAAAAATADPLG